MAPESYSKHLNLLQGCYNTQLPLPSSAIKNHNGLKEKKGYFRWQHIAKFITLLLAAQVGSVQASGDNATISKPRANEPIELTSMGVIQRFTPIENGSSLLMNQYAHDVDNKVYRNKRETLETNASSNTRISQELKQNILQRFDNITGNLQNIIKMFNATFDMQSSIVIFPTSLQFGQKCILNNDSISDLNSVINGLLLGINTTQLEVNCKPKADITVSSCYETLKLVQCGVNQLKAGFTDASQYIVSLEEYIQKNNKLYENFQKISDQINQQASEKYKELLNECNNNMQEILKYLNSTLLVSQLKAEITSLCISEIGNGHIETAVKKFKELNAFDDDHLIRNIIEKAYTDYGHLNNFDNIINFIAELPWVSMVISYEALLENMEKNTPKILIFATRVHKAKELYPMVNGDLPIARLDNLNNKTFIYVNNLINAWVDKIRNNDYEDILKFSETYTDAINFNLNRLIEKTYGNDLRNAEMIIEFTRNLTTINSSIVSLHSLFNQMKNHRNDLDSYELLMLAYYCKELMLMKSYDSLPPYYKDQLVAIKANLSDSVRRLIWDGSDCTMRNRVYNEYLYAANNRYAHDPERRRVYTLRTGKVNNECHWKITPRDYAKFFSIQNTNYNNEYLYAVYDGAAFDSERRHVYTWRPESEVADWTYWRLVPVSNGEYFILRYKNYDYEYLYPGFDKLVRDKEARFVFTWRKPEETPTKEGHWVISC